MKKIIIALLLVGLNAVASPRVGDRIEVVGKINFSQDLLGVQEVLAQRGNEMLIRSLFTADGITSNEEWWENIDDMFNTDDFDMIIGHCGQEGGSIQTITVPAGTFKTCMVPLSDASGHVWIGKVPFGTVKVFGNMGGTHMDASLKSYRFGK